jgi:chemotaxis signal transduction protein
MQTLAPENATSQTTGNALRFRLHSGACSLPLLRVHHIAAFATLSGVPDEYFLGWLRFHGDWVPVFDLDRVVHEQPSPATLGTRIILIAADEKAPVRLIGLLAYGVTDTVAAGEAGIEPLALDTYLPMLYALMPPLPQEPAA